jgi:hypothetical protein
MIRHKIFTKGEHIHCLITNSRFPNVLIPVRAFIHDVEFNDKMPRYQIRITKFYDELDFLKRYMFGMKYDKSFQGGYTKFNLTRKNFKTRKELENQINSNWETYLLVVDSVMCARTYEEIRDLYTNIQDFLIEKKIKELFELSNRSTYSSGKYFYKSRGIFEAHLKKFLGDRYSGDSLYFDKLLYKPTSKELDDLE